MFTGFHNQAMYYGVLDDAVERYPWSNQVDLHSIRQQLITSAIYGKRILINDGYIVANPLLVPDIRDINRSLVGALLTSGIARLFSRDRNADLVLGMERSAKHVTSHRRIVQNRTVWSDMRRKLGYLSSEVRHRTVVWPTRKNMGHLFYLLMERVAALPGERRDSMIPPALSADFDSIFRCFADNIDRKSYDGARTLWEEYAWRHFAKRDIDPNAIGAGNVPKEELVREHAYDDVKQMMNIANEIYHLAYSVGAFESVRNSASAEDRLLRVGVSTALVSIFPDIVGAEPLREEAFRPEKVGALNQLIITLPDGLRFSDDFSFVRSIQSDDEIRQSREVYLLALHNFANDDCGHYEAQRARDDYVALLANLMAPKLRVNRTLLGYKGFSELMLALATDGMLTPYFGWMLSTGVDHFRTKIIERLLVSRLEISMLEEGIHATQTRDAIPLARKYGFYLGPLKADGAQRLADQVGPHPAQMREGADAQN